MSLHLNLKSFVSFVSFACYLQKILLYKQQIVLSMSRKTKDFVPKIVAVEMLEKNGVDVERLKGLIRRGVGSEFSTYYHYTILRMHSTGLEILTIRIST
jgi:hypothetical protein